MKKAKALMIQGTASSAGKSILVTALCRIFKQDGCRVAPFKAQNMALNSFVTTEGGEIGRAQVVQAEAAGIDPTVDMNPVLLKPTTDTGCQVIVMGKVACTISARDYYQYTPTLLTTISGALERLRTTYDIVVIEGAGSPAEINLKEREIVNMRVAKTSGSPVLLVGDIDKGGVFASLVGTLELLEEDERRYFKGLIINKFRGDVSLLQTALDFTEKRTGLPILGVVPYFRNIHIAQEDSVYLDERTVTPPSSDLDIVVIRLPHISNYDDFDPFEKGGCLVRYISQRFEMGKPHLIIIPGTKSTISDLAYLQHTGLATEIQLRAKAGIPVVGICGGYQMLGQKILDPYQIESKETEISGLGLFDTVTEFVPEKATTQVRAKVVSTHGLLSCTEGMEVSGYEIHMGQTFSQEKTSAFRIIETPQGAIDYTDGSINEPGTVVGTYMHGLFHNDYFRQAFLHNLRQYWHLSESQYDTTSDIDLEYDKLANLVRQSLDIPQIYRIMEDGI